MLNRWTQLESQIDHSNINRDDSKGKEKDKDKAKEKDAESKESKDDESKESDDDRAKIFINCVCPGWVRTDMGGFAATRSVEKGAFGAVRLATLKMQPNFPNGCFFRDADQLSYDTANKLV